MELSIPSSILTSFGLDPTSLIERIGSGHINQTYKLIGERSFILQRINHSIFTKPEIIAKNLRQAARYLQEHHPSYLFIAPLVSTSGSEFVYDDEGFPWRAYPFIPDTYTVDQLENTQQAYSASVAFGQFNRLLAGEATDSYGMVLENFHDLRVRYQQFQQALADASPQRKESAKKEILQATSFSFLADEYTQNIRSGVLTPRIMHNDTKINNVLFSRATRNAMAVIDLDTVMPGYFIYDLGDMVRTFVSPVSEEEKDVSKIIFRKEFYDAVVEGYMSQMDDVLSAEEKKLIPFAGRMMTYIMALRFLADYLNGDVYYHTTYPGQNLVRAKNQLQWLELIHQHT